VILVLLGLFLAVCTSGGSTTIFEIVDRIIIPRKVECTMLTRTVRTSSRTAKGAASALTTLGKCAASVKTAHARNSSAQNDDPKRQRTKNAVVIFNLLELPLRCFHNIIWYHKRTTHVWDAYVCKQAAFIKQPCLA